MVDVAAIRQRFSAVAPFLNERGRRVVAAAEASAAGYGGIAAVTAATGLAASTIGRGLRELSAPEELGRIRRRGGGRKTAVAQDATSNDNQVRRLLLGPALSAALLLTAAPTALADSADLGLNPANADFAAYRAILDRDLHPNRAAIVDEVPGCAGKAQCAADVQATLWNENNLGAR